MKRKKIMEEEEEKRQRQVELEMQDYDWERYRKVREESKCYLVIL